MTQAAPHARSRHARSTVVVLVTTAVVLLGACGSGSGNASSNATHIGITGADGKRVGAGTFTASNLREDLTMTAALSLPRTRRVWVTDDQDHVVLDGYLPTS